MRPFLLLILLLACSASIAYSQPGAKPATGGQVPPPCLTPSQRAHLADSMAMLSQVRRAYREMRVAADTATKAAAVARRTSGRYAEALVAQQLRTTESAVCSQQWKRKARRRGLLNWLFTALGSGAAYLYFKP